MIIDIRMKNQEVRIKLKIRNKKRFVVMNGIFISFY